MNQLEAARTAINEIDQQMAALFEARMQAVEQVAAYKQQHGLPVLDTSRETQVVKKNSSYIQNQAYLPYYTQFITTLMNLSKEYQHAKGHQRAVAYFGEQGAFTYIAASRLFQRQDGLACPTFEGVFQAVQNGEAAYGVLPFENSYTGEVGEVLDLLLQYDVHITAIYDLAIKQNLLGLSGAKLSDIKQVYSHHQAIGQCKDFLDQHGFEVIPYANTAGAAQYVSEAKDNSKAAIASAETAGLFGLTILAENINTSAQNTTRFIVISNLPQTTGNRFNLLFTVGHKAGQLAKIMEIIGGFGFNLESIKSRPLHNLPWQYYFYIEVIGNLQDQRTRELIEKLKQNCTSLKVLGSYTVDDTGA